MTAWVSTPGWCWLAYGAVYSWSHPSLAHAWRCLDSCGAYGRHWAMWRLAAPRSFLKMVPASSTHLLAQPWVSLGRHLAAAVAADFGGGGPFGGVTGALAPLDGLDGPDGSLAVAFMDGPDGPLNGLAGLRGRPGWTGWAGGLAGSLGTLGGLVPGGGMGHVHGCPAGSMGGRGYGALGRIGLAALMGPFHGGSSPGDLTVWMPLATGEPGGTELGGNLGVKPPWLVLTGSALAACQYNAAGALTKRKINQPLRLLGGQVAMAPAGDVRYDQ